MKRSDEVVHIEEFVSNPSEITKYLVEIVLRLNDKHEKRLKTINIVKKFITNFKIAIYLKEDYYNFYLFLKNYKVPNYNSVGIKKLRLLFEEFERLYDKLIFNNHALTHAYAAKKKISNTIFTMEDKKIFLLKKLYHNEVTIDQFIKEFGHYAINPYELSAKRFEEYSRKKLLSIAKLVANFNIKKKVSLDEYINSKSTDEIPILIALRELAKYNILFIVRDIRYELVQLAKEKKISNIFNKSFDEIIELSKTV